MARPKLEPSDEQRRLVRSFSAYGIPQEQIAAHIGIRSPKTFRKHFRQEFDRGRLEANAAVAQTLFGMATSGRHPSASMFWLANRAGWKPQFAHATQAAPPAFIVAKDDGVKKS
jgi:hypothetical protein